MFDQTANPVTKPLPLQTETFAFEARRCVARLQCALILGQCVDGINRSQQHAVIRLLSRHYGVAGSPCWTSSGAGGAVSVCSGPQTVCVVAVRCIVARAHKVMCPCFVFLFVCFFRLPFVVSWLVHNGQFPGAEMLPARRHPRQVGGILGCDWLVRTIIKIGDWLPAALVKMVSVPTQKRQSLCVFQNSIKFMVKKQTNNKMKI